MYYFEAEDLPPSSNIALDPPGSPQFAYFTDVEELNLTLWGYVRMPSGKAIEGASVVVDGHEDLVVRSDAEGRYEIDWLTKGWWTIIVTAKGYTDAEFDVVMTLEQETKRHDVKLEPKDADGGDDEGRSLMFYLAVVLIIASIIIVVYAFTTYRAPKGR
ncbi:MAG: carboxypeptidase regulatory-like domain-containing protein, partial [Thermoplasmata archaeon]|nr:carboxypeptidase regulatory-like domain-containing protein [Thermoplasmata archaeon]